MDLTPGFGLPNLIMPLTPCSPALLTPLLLQVLQVSQLLSNMTKSVLSLHTPLSTFFTATVQYNMDLSILSKETTINIELSWSLQLYNITSSQELCFIGCKVNAIPSVLIAAYQFHYKPRCPPLLGFLNSCSSSLSNCHLVQVINTFMYYMCVFQLGWKFPLPNLMPS